ncbi:hypothetical protein ACIRRH_41660 [Kitasatospora sp. NPDC101235]|uniref:hypothetical protein n=1 Tax=Kitasatospora sp. NPDC101235 TaxID=3364101 RepID=UPI00382B4B38
MDSEHQNQAGPVDKARARELTEQLRTAIEDVRAAVLVLARRVRAAHQARVWTALFPTETLVSSPGQVAALPNGWCATTGNPRPDLRYQGVRAH